METLYSSIDFGGLNAVTDELFGASSPSFQEIFRAVVSGEMSSPKELIAQIGRLFWGELMANQEALFVIVIIAIAAAVFSNIAATLENHQIADISYFLAYLLLITILLKSFSVTVGIAAEAMQRLVMFMEVLVPAYLIAVSFTAGGTAAASLYATSLFAIAAVQWVLSVVVLPCIQIYVVVVVINRLSGEDMLKYFASLIRTVISYLLKTLLAVVIGIQVVQSLITPVIGTYKTALFQKAVSAIPGLGNAADATAQALIGSAVIIKNGIGVAALICIAALCLTPVLKIGALLLMYKLAAAFIGPVSVKSIAACVSEVGESTSLVLRTLMTAMILFMISIAIVTASTSGGL